LGSGVSSIKSLGTTLMNVELKASESDPRFDYDSELDKGKRIIDAEPNATITTTKV
jgi:hypothetical protein